MVFKELLGSLNAGLWKTVGALTAARETLNHKMTTRDCHGSWQQLVAMEGFDTKVDQTPCHVSWARGDRECCLQPL